MQNVKTFFRMFSQINQILNKKEKRTAIVIAFLSIISALLETLGVTAILPFILALLQPETLMDYDVLARIFTFFGISTTGQMIVFVAVGVVVIYSFKNVFLILFGYYKNNYSNKMERDLSVLMFDTFVHRPYSFFLTSNTAIIERGITSDITAVSNSVSAFCSLFNEMLTGIMIGVILFIIDPIMALGIVGLSGAITLCMIQALRKRISYCGEESRRAFINRTKTIIETISGIKEISVTKRQHMFLNKFKVYADKAYRVNTKYLTYSILPSRVTEMIFISGLIGLVLIAYNLDSNISLLIAKLSALAVAAIRLLPSITNISNNMNALVFQRPSLENAFDNLVGAGIRTDETRQTVIKEEVLTDDETELDFNRLTVNNISWKYSDDGKNVLSDLSLFINSGEAIGIIGESGAGKTTLADILLGLFVPQKGTVTIDNKSIFDDDTQWHKIIGYVPQSIFLMDDTIRNNILFGIDGDENETERLMEAIEKAQMKKFVDSLPNGLETQLGERGVKISGGQRQRIAIARALYYNPKVLILDEATSALDNETESAVIEAINALHGEKTLIIIAHRLSTIANCDRIFEIKNGQAIERKKSEVLGIGDREY